MRIIAKHRAAALAGLALLGLAGCSAVDTSSLSGMNPATIVTGGRDEAKEAEAAKKFARIEVCPEVQVRDGTQLLRIYEKGKQGDLSAVRFQASIGKFARECRPDGMGGTVVKVGIAGRLLNGPSGATGNVDLPIRIVLVKNGDQVLYSELHKVPAGVTAAAPSAPWTKVVDGITIPAADASSRLLIYVGFDEGKTS